MLAYLKMNIITNKEWLVDLFSFFKHRLWITCCWQKFPKVKKNMNTISFTYHLSFIFFLDFIAVYHQGNSILFISMNKGWKRRIWRTYVGHIKNSSQRWMLDENSLQIHHKASQHQTFTLCYTFSKNSQMLAFTSISYQSIRGARHTILWWCIKCWKQCICLRMSAWNHHQSRLPLVGQFKVQP